MGDQVAEKRHRRQKQGMPADLRSPIPSATERSDGARGRIRTGNPRFTKGGPKDKTGDDQRRQGDTTSSLGEGWDIDRSESWLW